MTQEEKARAYDEALERARKQRDEYQEEFDKTDKNSKLASILRSAISAVELAFPELVESEDERIRKELVAFFKAMQDSPWHEEYWHDLEIVRILVYLEKQKDEEGYEAIPVESTLEYKLGFKAGKDSEKQKEHKPAEWSDTNELVFKDICNHLEVEGYSGWVVLLNALRNGEFQSKQEWSEEDEEILKLLILNIGRYMYFGGMSSERILSFLKSLRPQQRQEWSEEEKEILDSILSHYVLIDKPIDANGIPKEKYISLIKSLRFDTYKNCNSHWKPSEEQESVAERFARIIRGNLIGIDKEVQQKFENLYFEVTGNKMYGGYND